MIDDRLKVIADHYGLDGQLGILQEECAELIQAVSKYKRCRTVASEDACKPIIAEEMADVYIMIEQIRYLLDIDDDFGGWLHSKIDRQMRRIREEKINVRS